MTSGPTHYTLILHSTERSKSQINAPDLSVVSYFLHRLPPAPLCMAKPFGIPYPQPYWTSST